MKAYWLKRENASSSILTLLMSAVVSLLGTRLFLKLTGYRQVGVGNWHVAHMLWGGLAMLLGMVLVLSFDGGKVKRRATVIFGAGFGLFIDEIGKFLTKDNDYFFRPAIIFIYFIFITLFLLYRFLERSIPSSPKEILFQINGRIEEIIEGKLKKSEKRELISKLNHFNKKYTGRWRILGLDLKALIKKSKVVNDRDGYWERIWKSVRQFGYQKVLKKKIMSYILGLVTIYYIVTGISGTFLLLTNLKEPDLLKQIYLGENIFSRVDIYMMTLKIIADGLVGLLFLTGMMWILAKKRVRGMTYFQWALLVNIFLSSVVRFYFEQFSAVFGLFFDIAIFSAVNRLKIDTIQEKSKLRKSFY